MDQGQERIRFSTAFSRFVHEFRAKTKQTKLEKQASEIQRIQKERYEEMSNEELAMQTQLLREMYEKNNHKRTPELINSSFAVVLEAVRRTKNNIHLTRSQIMASLVLEEGRVAELATGEGKTYGLTMATYLNALCGDQVHVFTSNDYLAERDSLDTQPIFEALGLKVGCAIPEYTIQGEKLSHEDSRKHRKEIYRTCDIVYAQPSTIAFDYLDDRRVLRVEDRMLSRPFGSAIVDEVDSVLIDNASVPFILSENINSIHQKQTKYFGDSNVIGKAQFSFFTAFAQNAVREMSKKASQIYRNKKDLSSLPVRFYETEHEISRDSLEKKIEDSEALIFIDEKTREVSLTDRGYDFLSQYLKKNKEDPSLLRLCPELSHFSEEEARTFVDRALQANFLMEKGKDYFVENGDKIVLIDSSTGRALRDNKFSDGLHQALEAKESIFAGKQSDQTISTARTTQPTFFAKYHHIAGTSGTARDETTKSEFANQYKMDVVKVPSAKPKIAVEQPSEIYLTRKEKMNAIVSQIKTCYYRQQPILVGAADVNEAREISAQLKGMKELSFKEIYQFFFPNQEFKTNQCMKLYCYLTDSPLPKRGDFEAKAALASTINALISPQKTESELLLEKQAMEKIRSVKELSEDSIRNLYQMKFQKEPTSKEQLQDLSFQISGIPNELLTAENASIEAKVISKAGRLGAVTISTAIAGRGTDIKIGGDSEDLAKQEMLDILAKENPDFTEEEIREYIETAFRENQETKRQLENMYHHCLDTWKENCKKQKEQILGDHPEVHVEGKGLYVLGASINQSIRVDNQLRGRCGRQGSDGESKFICSLEDPLFVQFAIPKKLEIAKRNLKNKKNKKDVLNFVRATQMTSESMAKASRSFSHTCEYGIDTIMTPFYDTREKFLTEPETMLSQMDHFVSKLFKDKNNFDRTQFQELVPLLFSQEELDTSSIEDLESKLSLSVSESFEAIKDNSSDFITQVSQDLLSVNDLLLIETLSKADNLPNQVSLKKQFDPQKEMDIIIFDEVSSLMDDLERNMLIYDAKIMITKAKEYEKKASESKDSKEERPTLFKNHSSNVTKSAEKVVNSSETETKEKTDTSNDFSPDSSEIPMPIKDTVKEVPLSQDGTKNPDYIYVQPDDPNWLDHIDIEEWTNRLEGNKEEASSEEIGHRRR